MKAIRKAVLLTVAYLFYSASINPWSNLYAAASGNYTDLLPIGAAENTTVISRGSGWALTTLAPSQTFGDALSRAPMTVFQSTVPMTISNTATVSTWTALSGIGKVGSTTFPAAWVATGRSMRISVWGVYSSSAVVPTWTWAVKLGSTTVLNTGAVSAPQAATREPFQATALLTIDRASGGISSVAGSYSIRVGSTSFTSLDYSTYTANATPITVNLDTQRTVNPTFKWGTASSESSITANNIIVEFLN